MKKMGIKSIQNEKKYTNEGYTIEKKYKIERKYYYYYHFILCC